MKFWKRQISSGESGHWDPGWDWLDPRMGYRKTFRVLKMFYILSVGVIAQVNYFVKMY